MHFRVVERKDYGFLYELLDIRHPEENITHNGMPTYAEHVDFMDAKPYKEDYIIEENEVRIGRLYITHDDKIGIHTIDKSEEKALQYLLQMRDISKFQFEVSPRNKRFMQILERNGYTLLHHTYARPRNHSGN
jgi:hypothetical protein